VDNYQKPKPDKERLSGRTYTPAEKTDIRETFKRVCGWIGPEAKRQGEKRE